MIDFLSLLARMFGRRQPKQHVDKYEKHIALPVEANIKPCRRAEERRKKRAGWRQFRAAGDPGSWPRKHLTIPRRIRRAAWRNGENPAAYVHRDDLQGLLDHVARM